MSQGPIPLDGATAYQDGMETNSHDGGTSYHLGMGPLASIFTFTSDILSSSVDPKSDYPKGVSSSTTQPTNIRLVKAIRDMETAFQQLHYKMLSVKQTADDLQELGLHHEEWTREVESERQTRATLLENDTMEPSENGMTSNSIRKTKSVWLKTRASEAEVRLEEPHALRLHQQSQQKDEAHRESHAFIAVKGFADGMKGNFDLRMNPIWMELTTKSTRALESAATGLGAARANAHSLINKSVALTKQTSREALYILSEDKPLWVAGDIVSTIFVAPISPHSGIRMAWDIAGCIMLIGDAFTLPVTLAWDMDLTNSAIGIVYLWTSLLFWTFDMLVNFNTGFYRNGTLHLDRKKIFQNYISGWFAFDLLIVSLDLFLAITPPDKESPLMRLASAMRSVRSLRALRAVRLLRLMKMRKFNAIIEEAALATGRPWLLIVVSMAKILVGMLVAAHVLSCVWYFIGRSVHDTGGVSWLDNMGAIHVTFALQYLHSLQWLLTPPAPAPIAASSLRERVGNIFIVVFTLIVMGSALGKFTSALQELNAMNSERSRKRREVRSYLQGNANSMELISRIMRFVDHKLSLQDSSASVDLSLISPTLQMELHVNQRSAFLEKHPLFCLTKDIYPTMYAHICGCAGKAGFEKGETVFQVGQFANTMVITALGEYTLSSVDLGVGRTPSNGKLETALAKSTLKISGVHWFAESCVYAEGMIHPVTLHANTFCDAFTLTSQHLQVALQDSPACTFMFCEYAKDFLSELKECGDPFGWVSAKEASEKAVKQNQHYMELYPDPSALIGNYGKVNNDEEQDVTEELSDGSPVLELANDKPSLAKRFVERALAGELSDQQDLSTGLCMTITELDPVNGSHATFSATEERDRSESSCLSILNLVADQYENFTSPQKPDRRLTPIQWQELREIIEWIAPTGTEVHAVIVLLAIRSLGKSKRLVQQLPRKRQRPEAAVMYLIEQVPDVVPSTKVLDDDIQNLLIETLRVHTSFNFAQMLQGENSPANVLRLQELIKDNIYLFKFYMLFLLGFMSGLAAGQGSRFMTSSMSQSIIMGCRALKCLLSATPQAIYWNYMIARASDLAVQTETPEDLALLRLACLSRVEDLLGYERLRAAWMSISTRARSVLLNHFLADGITERAFVLEFLPLCISNADKNGVVRLPALLNSVVEILDNLSPTFADKGADMLVTVDLSDLAEFVSVVKNRFVFQTSIMRSDIRLSSASGRMVLDMTFANWSRTNDSNTDMTALAYDVKHLVNQLDNWEVIEASPESNRAAKKEVIYV